MMVSGCEKKFFGPILGERKKELLDSYNDSLAAILGVVYFFNGSGSFWRIRE